MALITQFNQKLSRTTASAVVLGGAAILLTPLILQTPMALTDSVEARALLFYGVTSAAYCSLPYARRGDIVAVAMWLVLIIGVAPCFRGQELSASRMFADMTGVILAAAPIYIARLRQVLQGDIRDHSRRATDPQKVKSC
jgi:hypothetical protein